MRKEVILIFIGINKGNNMKTLKLATIALAIVIFSGCTKQPKPVAMNLYNPNDDSEISSGVSVVITEDMIKEVRARMRKNRNLK